jgi:hypothetical protein
LAFGGTVTTATDTINTVPACATNASSGTTGAAAGGGAGAGSSAATANAAKTPGLPNSGNAAPSSNLPLWSLLTAVPVLSAAVYLFTRKRI